MKYKALAVFDETERQEVTRFVETELVNLVPSRGDVDVTLSVEVKTTTDPGEMVFWRDGDTFTLATDIDQDVALSPIVTGQLTIEQAWEIFCSALEVIDAFPTGELIDFWMTATVGDKTYYYNVGALDEEQAKKMLTDYLIGKFNIGINGSGDPEDAEFGVHLRPVM